MTEPLADSLARWIAQSASIYRYYQLIIVVGPAGSGKTGVLQEVAQRTGAPYINVNLSLSQRLLDVAEAQRPIAALPLLTSVIETASPDGQCLLLDNLEMLFDLILEIDPLRALQQLARSRPIVAAWTGSIDNGYLLYAQPDHPEYRRYPPDALPDIVMLRPDTAHTMASWP